MKSNFIKAVERNSKAKSIRKQGFVPGVIYGEGEDTVVVKFESIRLSKLLKDNTKSSKIQVKLGDETKQCIVKEVQKDPATGDILHIDMQSIRKDESIKIKVPVVFNGRGMLESKNLLLENQLPEIELSGIVGLMPENIEIDVSDKDFGDKIFVKDIQVPEGLNVLHEEDELVAVISALKQIPQSEVETEEETVSEEIN